MLTGAFRQRLLPAPDRDTPNSKRFGLSATAKWLMRLAISTTYQPATDLGFLLHKYPERIQSFGEVWPAPE